jgi:hypothetical protein
MLSSYVKHNQRGVRREGMTLEGYNPPSLIDHLTANHREGLA